MTQPNCRQLGWLVRANNGVLHDACIISYPPKLDKMYPWQVCHPQETRRNNVSQWESKPKPLAFSSMICRYLATPWKVSGLAISATMKTPCNPRNVLVATLPSFLSETYREKTRRTTHMQKYYNCCHAAHLRLGNARRRRSHATPWAPVRIFKPLSFVSSF